MDSNYTLIGIFLIMIGFAMCMMNITYFKTRKLNLSWMCFGFVYTIGLLLLFTENPIKDSLHIASTEKFYSVFSLVILFIGIMLSYVLCGKKGDAYIIGGVLFSVGVHFIPFHTIYTYVLSVGLMLNAAVVFLKPNVSIFSILFIDAVMKILLGIYLILCV